MVEQPLPAGAQIVPGSLHAAGASRVAQDLDPPAATFFFDKLPDSVELALEVEASTGLGDVQLEGMRVMPMYEPELRAVGATSWLRR